MKALWHGTEPCVHLRCVVAHPPREEGVIGTQDSDLKLPHLRATSVEAGLQPTYLLLKPLQLLAQTTSFFP